MFGKGGFLNPKKLLTDIGVIGLGQKVADFGCGSGYFSLPLAELVGSDGAVNAVDVLESALQVVTTRAKNAGFFNVKTIHANLEKEHGSGLATDSQDIVLMANVLFQSQKKEEIISEAVRVIKPGGRVIIIEWFPDSYFMTDRGWRIDPEKLKKILEKNGLILDKEFQPDDYHYGLVYRKME